MWQEPDSKRRHSQIIPITASFVLSLQVPVALVSLVDEKVQWFKSAHGLPGVDRTARPTSFCAW
jgi:hypothetical protein